MEPKSHKKRNLLILLAIVIIIVLIIAKKKDLGLVGGPAGLSEEEKAALIEKFSREADENPINLTPAQKEAATKKIQASSSSESSATLTEEQKAELIKEMGSQR